MAMTRRGLLTALQTVIASISPSGGYTHSLTGTGAVVIGAPINLEPSPPQAWIFTEEGNETFGHHFAGYDCHLKVAIQLFVRPTAGDTDSRILAACDIADDVVKMLRTQNTRSDGPLGLRAAGMLPMTAGFDVMTDDGSAAGWDTLGLAMVRCEFQWVAE